MKHLFFLILLACTKLVLAQDQKLFLLTDRENYAPGDTIWIQAKLLNAKDNSYANTQDILYIGLDALKKSKAVISQFKNGNSNSQLVIPRSFKPGIYTLQAYTKYLEQFGNVAYFTKKIKVSIPGIPTPLAQNSSKSADKVLNFYPEGGKYLVAFSSKIGFKINLPKSDLKGNKGQIIDKQGIVVASFYPDLNGIGHVSFMPKPYEKYTAIFKTASKKHEQDLPEALFSGLSLSVDNVVNRPDITITVNNASNVPDTVYVHVYKNDSLVFNNMIYTENQQYKLSINSENFDQEGLVQVLLLDARKQTIADRWIFVSKENNYSFEKEIRTEKVGLANTETLEITLKDQNDKPIANQALTVKISNKEKDVDYNKSLRSYLNFGSQITDLKAKIDTFFEQSATASAYNFDNLLLSYTPNKQTINKGSKAHEEYFTLKARVFHNGQSYTGQTVKLFIKDKYSISSYDLSVSDSSEISIGGNWFDSLTVFATDIDFKPLELGFEKNNYVPSKPKLIRKTPLPKTTTAAIPEVAILKTDPRRKRYTGKADQIVKPKNTRDTSSNILQWTAEKLKKTKFDSLQNFQSLESLNNASTDIYLDGAYISKDVLSLISQRDIAQIDVLYKTASLATFNKKEGLVLHILSKSKRAKDIAIAPQSTQKILAFEPLANFKTRNRTLNGMQTILWAPDMMTDKNGKISIKLSPYNKTLPYVIGIKGLDSNGNIIEDELPLSGEK